MARRAILVDTSALYALVDHQDRHHAEVAHCLRELDADGATLVVIEPVFIEAITLIKRRLGAAIAVEVGRRLRASQVAQLTHLGTDDRESSWAVFERFADKDWTYVDCACLAVMQRHDIAAAVSVDRHFDQMGVVRLPSHLTPGG